MTLNLLPKNERPLKKNTIRPQFLLIVLALTLALASGVHALSLSLERNALREELANTRQYRQSLQAQRAVIDQLEADIAAVEAKQNQWLTLVNAAEQAAQSRRFDDVAQLQPTRLWFEETQLTASGLNITGYAHDVAVLSRYIHQLEAFGYSVTLDSLESHRDMGLYVFRIRLQGGQQP